MVIVENEYAYSAYTSRRKIIIFGIAARWCSRGTLANIEMTRLTKISFTLLLGGIALSCQNQIQNKTNDSIEVLSNIDTIKVSTIQLLRPNSGTFSFEEAEKRKNEIYDMQLSVKYFDWKNPTSGGALHINQNDEIEVYQFTMGMMYLGEGVDTKGDSVVYVN